MLRLKLEREREREMWFWKGGGVEVTRMYLRQLPDGFKRRHSAAESYAVCHCSFLQTHLLFIFFTIKVIHFLDLLNN